LQALSRPTGETREKPSAYEHGGTAASGDRTGTIAIASCLVLSGVIFIGDIMLPLGVAGGVPYVAVVLLAMWAPSPGFVYLTAVLGSLLTVAGYFVSPEGGILWVVLLNRSLALFAIWVTAILGSRLTLALKAAREEKNKTRKYLEAAGTVLMTLGADQKIKMINKMGCALLGYDEDEITGKNWFDNFIPERMIWIFVIFKRLRYSLCNLPCCIHASLAAIFQDTPFNLTCRSSI